MLITLMKAHELNKKRRNYKMCYKNLVTFFSKNSSYEFCLNFIKYEKVYEEAVSVF